MGNREAADLIAPWRCPVCRARLELDNGARCWSCIHGHSFDAAREGYVNLLLAGQRRSRQPGDSKEMVAARHRFLGTGAYDCLSAAVADIVAGECPAVVLDVGCGDGRHTRAARAPSVLGLDVAKPAVAVAARADPRGWYAVASAADLPLDDSSVDVTLNVFGPVLPAELARVLRPGGRVVAAHPGPMHLAEVRALIYEQARPHEVKPPLRNEPGWFTEIDRIHLAFPVVVTELSQLQDLFAMTPYRWHARPDIQDRLAQAVRPSFATVADIQLTIYRRTSKARAAGQISPAS